MYYAPGSVEISAAPYLWTILTVFAACVLLLARAALVDSELDTWVLRARSRYSFCPNHPAIDRYLGTGPVRAR